MNLVSLVLLIPLLIAAPSVKVTISSDSPQEVELEMKGIEENFEQCLEGGLEVRYRFEYQICKHRNSWFDGCGNASLTVNRVLYDPISESYKIVSDRHGDKEPPGTKTVPTLAEAIRAGSLDRKLPLTRIARGDSEMLTSDRSYLSVRGQVVCHGSYNKTLTRIYSVLTLGIAGEEGIETGWFDYPLNLLRSQDAKSDRSF